jgi:hydrogenase maturation protease
VYFVFHALSQVGDRGTLIRIIGIGSPFGDDAAGLEVARILTQAPPPNCEVIVADRPGAGLLELLDSIDPVILIDAVRSGAKPGTLHQLSFDELDRCPARFVSSHELGVAASVQLASRLGRAPARGGVLGIEVSPAVVHVPCPLSRTMQQAVRQAVPQLLRWANELSRSPDELPGTIRAPMNFPDTNSQGSIKWER